MRGYVLPDIIHFDFGNKDANSLHLTERCSGANCEGGGLLTSTVVDTRLILEKKQCLALHFSIICAEDIFMDLIVDLKFACLRLPTLLSEDCHQFYLQKLLLTAVNTDYHQSPGRTHSMSDERILHNLKK